MGKRLAFLFALISFILVGAYSYGLINNGFSKNVFNNIDRSIEIPNNEGVDEVDDSPVDERVDEVEQIQEEKDIDLVLDELKSRKTEYLLLVNKWNTLNEDYAPSTLSNIVLIYLQQKVKYFYKKQPAKL